MKYQKLITDGIRRLRKRNGLTQELFAEKIGLTVEAVRNIEYNKYTPTAKTIDSICNSFKISPFELMLPEIEQDEDLLIEIDKKLKLCTNKDLRRINALIDIIRN